MSSSNQTAVFKIAIIQHPPVFLNFQDSLIKARTLIGQAAGEGANLVVFPETWLPGYPVWLDFSPKAALWDHPPAKALYRVLAENSVVIPSHAFEELLALAGETGTYVVMGMHELHGGTLYNTMLFINKNGRDFRLHRKLMPTYSERMIWGRGDGSTLSILETEYGNIGGLICWEHWMPLARAAMHAKQETVHIAQWPMVKEHNLLASRHYAFEGQCFVIAAGCVLSKADIIDGFTSLPQPENPGLELLETLPGEGADLILKGGSAIIAPNSDYLIEPVTDKPETLFADIEPGMIKEGHLVLDSHGHYARPDVFRLEVNDEPQRNVIFKSEIK
ncbi:MAG: carbon-nitrogen hydrolase family protein [bacterium]